MAKVDTHRADLAECWLASMVTGSDHASGRHLVLRPTSKGDSLWGDRLASPGSSRQSVGLGLVRAVSTPPVLDKVVGAPLYEIQVVGGHPGVLSDGNSVLKPLQIGIRARREVCFYRWSALEQANGRDTAGVIPPCKGVVRAVPAPHRVTGAACRARSQGRAAGMAASQAQRQGIGSAKSSSSKETAVQLWYRLGPPLPIAPDASARSMKAPSTAISRLPAAPTSLPAWLEKELPMPPGEATGAATRSLAPSPGRTVRVGFGTQAAASSAAAGPGSGACGGAAADAAAGRKPGAETKPTAGSKEQLETVTIAGSDVELEAPTAGSGPVRAAPPGSALPLCIEMEDVTSGMHRPCLADLKVGLLTSGPDASLAKQKRSLARYPPQVRSGYRVTGLRVWRGARAGAGSGTGGGDGGGWDSFGRDFGKRLDASELAVGLGRLFVAGDGTGSGLRIQHAAAGQLLSEVRRLVLWSARQTTWRLFGTSVLLAFEGQPQARALERGEAAEEAGEEQEAGGPGALSCKARLIDFANAWPASACRSLDPDQLAGARVCKEQVRWLVEQPGVLESAGQIDVAALEADKNGCVPGSYLAGLTDAGVVVGLLNICCALDAISTKGVDAAILERARGEVR